MGHITQLSNNSSCKLKMVYTVFPAHKYMQWLSCMWAVLAILPQIYRLHPDWSRKLNQHVPNAPFFSIVIVFKRKLCDKK